MSPTHIFELFFDDEVIKLLITESLNYAVYRSFTNTNLSTDEIKCFIGILILSGYNTLPGRRFYWDSSPDMQNIIVRDCMRRDRFEEICRILHCADNSNINSDKYYKLKPLKNRFLKHFVPEQELNYDESMIKYFDGILVSSSSEESQYGLDLKNGV
ncbi:piggyBac transposable element-derived protein 2-like [Melanaphis sacchari]|uniref:piggyBac transposable element-derived protein 2-like n=1 Tax=Melanaphis sacchari TaxID=742174 RepID=UPI000DC13E29|nr:piggyBac transposable element-derived protein 2-like [Melanaphis sacchari]